MTARTRLILASLILAGVSAPALSAEATRPAAVSDVRHQPVTPQPDVPMLVPIRVAEAVTKPALKIQAVAPGKHIPESDAEYEKDTFFAFMQSLASL